MADVVCGFVTDKAVPRVFERMLMHDCPTVLLVTLVLIPVKLPSVFCLQIFLVVVLDVDPPFVLTDDTVFETHRCFPRVEVHLADRARPVARCREYRRPRVDSARLQIRSQIRFVVENAGPDRVQPSKQRRTHWDTDRRRGDCPSIPNPLLA